VQIMETLSANYGKPKFNINEESPILFSIIS
jgi:hypothetical protein